MDTSQKSLAKSLTQSKCPELKSLLLGFVLSPGQFPWVSWGKHEGCSQKSPLLCMTAPRNGCQLLVVGMGAGRPGARLCRCLLPGAHRNQALLPKP